MKKFGFIFFLFAVIVTCSIPTSLFAQKLEATENNSLKTILVNFSVDLELVKLNGLFNPLTDTVSVGGNFNKWGKVKMVVTQSNPDIYSVNVTIDAYSFDDTIRFNFCIGQNFWETEQVNEYIISQIEYETGLARVGALGFNSTSLADFPMKLKFNCDMKEPMRKGDFIRGDQLFVRGDFNDWSGSDFELHDVDGDSIYSRTFQNFHYNQPASFNFVKYHGGVYTTENYPTRKYKASLLGLNTYSAPWEGADQFHIPKSLQVTFSANLELERLAGLFNPVTDSIFVGGEFNNWQKVLLTQNPSDKNIFSTTLPLTLAMDDTIQFKFCVTPDTWENPGRKYVVSQSDFLNASADLNCFGFQYPSLDSTSTVLFKCNMSVMFKRGEFVAGDKLVIRGDFNGWGGNDFELTDPDGDSIYTGMFTNFIVDQSIIFKFVRIHGTTEVWERSPSEGTYGVDRKLIIGAGANYYTDYWEGNSVYKPTKTIQVTFTINMELERLSGLFNPQTDTLSVRGSFNGWGNTWMAPLADSLDIYKVTAPVIAQVGEKISFKFFYTPSTWEGSNLTDETQNDRYFIVNQTDFDSGVKSYDAIGFNNAYMGDHWTNLSLLFTCNTNAASIKNAPDGTEFKTIHLAGGAAPFMWPSTGWPDQDITKVFQLYDDGTNGDEVAGDKIFSSGIHFPFYSPNTIVYKYSANWGLPTNGGSNDNEDPAYGYKVIYLNHELPWGWHGIVRDTFGIAHTTDFTDVKIDGRNIPTEYKLEQNFPNPFNPNTVISYQLSVDSKVSLKVFDILGNEFAALVNEEQPAGNYRVEFSSKNKELSSGIYFYQLRAGSFVQTKKMILLK